MQCVEYYCVFMQLPMSNHSIDHINATSAAFPGLDIVTYSNIALSYETQNAKHKLITFFYWKYAFLNYQPWTLRDILCWVSWFCMVDGYGATLKWVFCIWQRTLP